MNALRFAKTAEYAQTLALPACVLVLLGASGLAGLDSSTGAPPMLNRVAPALAANTEPAKASLPSASPASPVQAVAKDNTKDSTKDISTAAALPAQDGVATDVAANVEFSVVPHETAADNGAIDKAERTTTGAALNASAEATAPAEANTPAQATAPTEANAPAEANTPAEAAAPEPQPIVVASLPDSAQTLPAETAPAPTAADSAPDQTAPAQASPQMPNGEANLNSVDVFDECYAADACIDRYLWALYRRTPKEDAIKVQEQSKVTVKRKGKLVTVTRTSTHVVDEDFAWKDPKAAQHANMPIMDYVIDGMDEGFKLKLFRALRAAEHAGFSPGITSAFRDDYRQSIASGLKAADNRSYHGGSLRGGYGHGLAADIVSVKGATRAERLASSDALWKWVDIHGPQYGIARPYLDHDPPHVAPFDGQEYASHRGAKQNLASSKPHKGIVARADHGAIKHIKQAKSS